MLKAISSSSARVNAIANSIDTKRASAQIDVITAEDVSRYPDVNVAESLSRLPGCHHRRTAGGEGAKVSINGIDSRLILTQFNGQPIATTESGANNRDTGRSFNFRNLAPEADRHGRGIQNLRGAAG